MWCWWVGGYGCKRSLVQNLVKIGSVGAEILLIWTNVLRRNIAWTNRNLQRLPMTFLNELLVVDFPLNRIWEVRTWRSAKEYLSSASGLLLAMAVEGEGDLVQHLLGDLLQTVPCQSVHD